MASAWAPESLPPGLPDRDAGLALVTSTWRALLAPRRLIPILVIAGPLAATQAWTGSSVLETVLLCLLCVVFVAVGPVSWRLVMPPSPPSFSTLSVVVRIAVYAGVGVACVWGFGAVLPWLLTHDDALPVLDISGMVTIALWWVGGWGLGRDVESEAGLVAERRRAERWQREAEAARLLALRNHLDPHFLFNTLNAIAEWCRTDGEVAERAVLQLSAMLRVMLEGVKQPIWPLARELELVTTLFSLHRMRDPDLFTFAIAGDTDGLDVPPLLLLPLAENAMKHGPARGHRGAVTVEVARAQDGTISVTVENPGGYAGRRTGGEGLATVEARLALATDGRGRVTMTTVTAAGSPDRTRAVVVWPGSRP